MNQALATRTLNDRQADFVAAYVEIGEATAAAIAAGYSAATARVASTQILSLPHIALAISRAARLRLARGVPLALNTLEYLVEKAVSEKVRLDASKALLDRAGIVPPKAQENPNGIEKPLHEMSMDELRAMANRLEDELAGRAKVVTDVPDPVAELLG
jgi:phage terminase small subunit